MKKSFEEKQILPKLSETDINSFRKMINWLRKVCMKDDKDNLPRLDDFHYFLFNESFNPTSSGKAISFIICRNLMKKKPKMIKMIINSNGGEVPSAFALIDIMQVSDVPIYTYGLGEISSCALMTFMAGKKGCRFITNNTTILSHQFYWSCAGKEHELMAKVKEYNNASERYMRLYRACTGLSEKDVKKYLLPPEDVWLSAKEAVKLGIADEIVTSF
jgi:ATP-dependent protease ClpP protease subunit